MDIKKMLEDQAEVVEAAHKTRLAALKKYGLGSPQYRAANKAYQEEFNRYSQLDLENSIHSFGSRLDESMRAINPMFQGFYQRFEEIDQLLEGHPIDEIIDVDGHAESYQTRKKQDRLSSNSKPELTPSQKLQRLRNKYLPQLPKSNE